MTCLSMLQLLCFPFVKNLMLWFGGITYLTIIKKIICAEVLRCISNRLAIAGTLKCLQFKKLWLLEAAFQSFFVSAFL